MEEHQRSLVHLNGDLLCSIAIHTTGDKAGLNDLVEVAILPLNSEYRPMGKKVPFFTALVPKRMGNVNYDEMTVNKQRLYEISLNGLDPYTAADRFDEWFARFGLKNGKRIVPLIHDWGRIRGFIIDWLGWESFFQYFSDNYRDIMCIGSYLNDRAINVKAELCPHPKVTMQFFCSQLKISRKSGDIMMDCMLLGQIYDRLLRAF